LTTRVEQLEAFYDQLSAVESPPIELPETARHEPALARARKALEQYRQAAANLNDTFLERVGRKHLLNDALNELMALFTPSRWAYEDVRVTPKAEAKEGTELKFLVGSRDSPAALRLNTSELNLFAIALFLLCARQRRNRLRLLILDDPLQNMDELTVTAFARGLAKVLSLWFAADQPRVDQWQVMILLHGKKDLERFRRELPSAFYHLPWLSPSPRDRELKIRPSEPSTPDVGFQDLGRLMSPS
jgi:hypothetical protein